MAGRHLPLPFSTGASSTQNAGLYFPLGLRLGTNATQQAGLFFPFRLRIGVGESVVVEEEKPDGAGGHKHVLVFPRHEEEREKVVEQFRQEAEITIDDGDVSISLPAMPAEPIKAESIPVSFEADRELIELIRLDELFRYQQLIDALIKDEENLMEEITMLLMLDA